jgi:putative DNA primase/helicase
MSIAPVSSALPQLITPNFDNMPPELKQRPNWVLWVPISTGVKWTKRPIQTSGFGASTTNPRHWSSFEDARRHYERAVEKGGILLRERTGSLYVPIGGVGFVFDNQQDENGLVLVGIDFDRVVSAEGKIASFAAERIKRLRSYSELSVSGSGLHTIAKAHPLRAGVSLNGIEIYTGERYFTMTGRTGSKGVPIVRAEQQVAALVDELLRAQNGTAAQSGTTASTGYSPE